MSTRLDLLLVELGLAPSRTKAHELIDRGAVSLRDEALTNKSLKVRDEDRTHIRVTDSELFRYVSRGGLKLQSALEYLSLSVQDWVCLDVGQSTGGFTDCLLQRGARSVFGFDVGHGQLHPQLAKDPRVTFWEGLHVKDMANHPQLSQKTFDLVVADLSFISISQALPQLVPGLESGGVLLVLIKPQFEVGAVNLDKAGVVKNADAIQAVLRRIQDEAEQLALSNIQVFPAGLAGRDGNQEYFLYGKK